MYDQVIMNLDKQTDRQTDRHKKHKLLVGVVSSGLEILFLEFSINIIWFVMSFLEGQLEHKIFTKG